MGYGPFTSSGGQKPISPYKGSWAETMQREREARPESLDCRGCHRWHRRVGFSTVYDKDGRAIRAGCACSGRAK